MSQELKYTYGTARALLWTQWRALTQDSLSEVLLVRQAELLQLTSYSRTIGCKSLGGCHSCDKELGIYNLS